ncbi:ribosomal protein 60S [Gymnopus androsaceus JB14]|uniref:Ribosomal protein 60S n=1 Tax=Gymnopus androsaceus JB14 TaxID=1447944 RepID=A0A6A4HTE4_9AGAR|nr:ribosomal protein 60S [Gymnopus androsaceus JB14]
MRYLAAYLLLQMGGNASPSAADIKRVLSSVGIESDDERLDKLMSQLEGKDINTLITEGTSKLASLSSGGAAVASGGGTALDGGAAAPAAEKEEEKKEEEEEESDEEMFGLFDD